MSLLACLPIQAAKDITIHHSDQVSYLLPDLQDQKLLTLCWRSFSKWGTELVTVCFAYIGGQELICECLQPIATQITQQVRRKVFDALLTSVSTGSSLASGRVHWSAWQWPYRFKNRRFFKCTITLRPQILIREFRVWYVKYTALHWETSGGLRFSISSNLSKW